MKTFDYRNSRLHEAMKECNRSFYWDFYKRTPQPEELESNYLCDGTNPWLIHTAGLQPEDRRRFVAAWNKTVPELLKRFIYAPGYRAYIVETITSTPLDELEEVLELLVQWPGLHVEPDLRGPQDYKYLVALITDELSRPEGYPEQQANRLKQARTWFEERAQKSTQDVQDKVPVVTCDESTEGKTVTLYAIESDGKVTERLFSPTHAKSLLAYPGTRWQRFNSDLADLLGDSGVVSPIEESVSVPRDSDVLPAPVVETVVGSNPDRHKFDSEYTSDQLQAIDWMVGPEGMKLYDATKHMPTSIAKPRHWARVFLTLQYFGIFPSTINPRQVRDFFHARYNADFEQSAIRHNHHNKIQGPDKWPVEYAPFVERYNAYLNR